MTGQAASRRDEFLPTEVASSIETAAGPRAQASAADELFGRPREAQHAAGYYHTLREIWQQPATWRRTAAALVARQPAIERFLGQTSLAGPIVLTGSGSSFYGAECLALTLQAALQVPVIAVSGGQLLTEGVGQLPVAAPSLMVSLARSGNSPESCAAVDLLLDAVPACRHVLITCNHEGRLASQYLGNPQVLPIVLDDVTCDRSLVMTSSLTNMIVAGRFLGLLRCVRNYERIVNAAACTAARILSRDVAAIAAVARGAMGSAVFLGSGPLHAAAREAALKMLEMTAGQTSTLAETYLGLRHGPMSAVHANTAVACFLSSDPAKRAYEVDLIRELHGKSLGLCRIVVGRLVPHDLYREGDLVIELAWGPTGRPAGDADLPVLDILVGQLLAFFRCLHTGFEPDRPSATGAINRVVAGFEIHGRQRTPAVLR